MPHPPLQQPDLSGWRCLVLGAGGFIGTHLCRGLLAGGATVRGFGRSRPHAAARDGAGLDGMAWTTGHFSDRAALARALDGVDAVFHLIGGSVPESSNRDPEADLLASVPDTLHLLDLCRTSEVRRLVFLSSGGTVYGVPPDAGPIPESAPTNPISAYGVSRLAIEKYLGLYRHLYGLDSVILRVANPYGPLQSPHRRQGVVAAMAHCALTGRPLEIWGAGDVVRDFIYIDDVVAAIVAMLDYHGPHRVLNVGSGIGRSVAAIADDLERLLGRPLPRRHRAARPADVPVNVLDIGRITGETGWRPRTAWPDGLAATLTWLAAAEAAAPSFPPP